MNGAEQALEPVSRGYIPASVGETAYLEKSPFIQGFLAGLKGALVGGAAGAITQAVRGKSPITGAIAGALGVGAVSALAKSTVQKMENISQEEIMRYHINQMKGREPFVFMPPPSLLSRSLSRLKEQPGAN